MVVWSVYLRIKARTMTDLEIQKYIKENCRYPDGSSAMDEQAFYEGAKWYRDYVVNKLTIPRVVKAKRTVCPYCDTELEDAIQDICMDCWSKYRNP